MCCFSFEGRCLARLLGVGTTRLERAQAACPDLRCGFQERPSTEQADSVRSFFHRTYTKLAECMPDKFIRRGRAKKKSRKATTIQPHDSDSSDSLEIVSGPDDEDGQELLAWLDRASDSAIHNSLLNSGQLVKRWLPPGNLAELYDHYVVATTMNEGVSAASFLGFVFLHCS